MVQSVLDARCFKKDMITLPYEYNCLTLMQVIREVKEKRN